MTCKQCGSGNINRELVIKWSAQGYGTYCPSCGTDLRKQIKAETASKQAVCRKALMMAIRKGYKMIQEIFNEEELEERADEARDKEVAKVLANIRGKYKALFGEDPDEELPISEIQDKIRIAMPRPYKL